MASRFSLSYRLTPIRGHPPPPTPFLGFRARLGAAPPLPTLIFESSLLATHGCASPPAPLLMFFHSLYNCRPQCRAYQANELLSADTPLPRSLPRGLPAHFLSMTVLQMRVTGSVRAVLYFRGALHRYPHATRLLCLPEAKCSLSLANLFAHSPVIPRRREGPKIRSPTHLTW